MSKNAEGWIRHRAGRKCPVESGVKVDYRMRSKKEAYGERAELLDWGLDNECPAGDIMAYRLHKPVERVEACSKPELRSLPENYGEIIGGSVEGPIQWRDRITEIDATTQALTAERAELVQKLASEGFALIGRVVEPVEDVSLRNIKDGDTVVYVKESNGVFTNGRKYSVLSVDSSFAPYNVIDDEGDENCLSVEECAFHSRPSA